jgi:asparagine synthase (glutamine-hydrolysing)
VLVFNGEIYNYKELRLAIPNYPFKTQSDTEVLMAAFCTWGIDCLKKIDGMFAFAIWDKQDEILWLARDRMGVKPLYFFQENGLLAFSSEKRSLMDSGLFKRSLNYDSVFEYLSYHST